MTATTFTALFPFGGLGAGARGFLDAQIKLLGREARFRILGGIDFDPIACADFEKLTGSPSWCIGVEDIDPAELVARYGAIGPDCVFLSPPCKGSSRLLSAAKAATEKYQAMNRLAVVWVEKMLAAWKDAPPKLVLLENVPGLPTRAKEMLRDLKKLLRAAGYVFHAGTHDCGEVGGLAQHRTRFLLAARHAASCPPLLYQPPKRRVRGVGEVLSTLPMPATVAASAWGDLHTMPRLSWRNWLRLALIPAGGDWRDLKGVLDGRARREVFRRHAIADWREPIDAVTGPGGHSVEAVSDPRVAPGEGWNHGAYAVQPWETPSNTVTSGAHPSKGEFSIADPRVASELDFGESTSRHWNKSDVRAWTDPALTVIGKEGPANGGASVADPRVAEALPVPVGYDAAYGVLGWTDPARTVAGNSAAGCGAYAVADPRERGFLDGVRFLALDEAMALALDPAKPPPFTPVIVAEDRTWHRPLTLLELAALQGIPAVLDGKPLTLGGTRTQKAEHIGNAVPVAAAMAIAERMLVSLVEASLGTFSLSSGNVWVTPTPAELRA